MLKKVAYVIAEAGEARLRQAGWRAGDSGQQMSQLEPRGRLLSEVPLPRGPSVFTHKAFDRLCEAHPQHAGSSALLRVDRFKCQSHLRNTSQKHLDWCSTKRWVPGPGHDV